jgi:hypothetical protein
VVSHVYVLVWNILAQPVGGNTAGLRAVRLGAAKTAAAHVCTVQSKKSKRSKRDSGHYTTHPGLQLQEMQ